ncbi:uncharacterized protein LOC135826446 isoform X1 [Sycon ciliatum]|uniref:uncharacterized protein LOC135826446 isoform X1 n=1 Tax=Sycon ciliatum TaxID=27933 RepID=UPI0031F6FEB2
MEVVFANVALKFLFLGLLSSTCRGVATYRQCPTSPLDGVEMGVELDAPLDWYQAQRRCRDDGGHLATVSTGEDLACACNALMGSSCTVSSRVHVGMNSFDKLGTFRWPASGNALQPHAVNATGSNLVRWITGTPSSSADSRCGFWESLVSGTGIGNGVCTQPLPYLCQRNRPRTRIRGGFDAILPACNDRSFYYRSLGLTRNESAEFCQANRGMLARSSAANDVCILRLLRSLGRPQLPIWTRRGCDVNTGAAILTDDCLIRPDGDTGTTRHPEFGQSEPRPFVCEMYPDCTGNTHDCHAQAYCSQLPGQEYQCTCTVGFTGDGRTCVEIPGTTPMTEQAAATTMRGTDSAGAGGVATMGGLPASSTVAGGGDEDEDPSSASSSMIPVFAGIAAGVLLLLFLSVVIAVVVRRRRRRLSKDTNGGNSGAGSSNDRQTLGNSAYDSLDGKTEPPAFDNLRYHGDISKAPLPASPPPKSPSTTDEREAVYEVAKSPEPVYEKCDKKPDSVPVNHPNIYNVLHGDVVIGRNGAQPGDDGPPISQPGQPRPNSEHYHKLQHTGEERTSAEGNTMYDSVPVKAAMSR